MFKFGSLKEINGGIGWFGWQAGRGRACHLSVCGGVGGPLVKRGRG